MTAVVVTAAQAETLGRCLAVGGVAIVPAGGTYALACDPAQRAAVERLRALTRAGVAPLAALVYDLGAALAALPEQGPRTHAALRALLPGDTDVLLANPAERFPLAGEPRGVRLRVPALGAARGSLAGLPWPMLAAPAPGPGGRAARRVGEVAGAVRGECELVLNAGALSGVAPTLVDLRDFELDGVWRVLEGGAVPPEAVARRLG